MQRPFSTFVGIDLGGARGKTTALACLCTDGTGCVLVHEVTTRSSGGAGPWHDDALVEYLAGLGQAVVIAINAPLTVPACLRCQLAACPGKELCVDPAVLWLRTEGVELASEAVESDLDRIAAIPASTRGMGSSGGAQIARTRPRVEPYIHRGTELKLHYQHGLVPRDYLGQGTGPIAARASHLRRVLAGMGFEVNRNLLEVSPRATVHALFGPAKARGYKRDADPWETRVSIIEALGDLRFSPRSRLSREEVLRNDHCFEAVLSGYTAFLWARDGWSMPEGIFATDGWIWVPPAAAPPRR